MFSCSEPARDEIRLEREMHVLRDVVQQHGQRALVGDTTVVRLERSRRHGRPVVVRRHDQHRVRTVIARHSASLDALARRLRSRADDEQHVARQLATSVLDERTALLFIEERRFTGRPAHDDPAQSRRGVRPEVGCEGIEVHRFVSIAERRHHRCDYAAQIEHYRLFPRFSAAVPVRTVPSARAP